jgi:hypothetical protein
MDRENRIPHLRHSLIEAVKLTLGRDSALFAIGVHEQTVCHRIARHLENLWDSMDGMSIDCEYNRDVARCKKYDFEVTNMKKKFRPDIILHERMNAKFNMLAVESKPEKVGRIAAAEDRRKIERVVTQEPYRYDLGCVLSFLNKPRRHDAGVSVKFFTERGGWSEAELFTEKFTKELEALSARRTR